MRKVLALLLLAALSVGLVGCGAKTNVLSQDEYSQRMMTIQEGLTQNLKDLSDRLGSIGQLDYYDLADLQGQVLDTADAFKAALKEAEAINAPDQVEDLHKDFTDFYAYGEDVAGRIANDVAFFHRVLPMLTDVENLALPNMVPDAEMARLQAAADEDVSTMKGYEKDLNGMSLPSELEPYKETLTNFFRSIENAVGDTDRAITPQDKSQLLQFQQDFKGVIGQRDVYAGMIPVYLVNFKGRIDYLDREAQALNDRL
jgi:hypothetical protein